MSYEQLWVVGFRTAEDPDRLRVAGPFPAIEPAQAFDRRLRAEWPDEDLEAEVLQVESTEPFEELVSGDG
jgi:hypothetical protein